MIDKYIPVGECRIHCLQTETTGSDVLLLHGASFEAQTWKDLGTMDRLHEAGYRATALDMPDFGKSAPCNDSLDHLLSECIRREQLMTPTIVGPSMGGRLAMEYAINHPDMVGGLVLIDMVEVDRYLSNVFKLGDMPVLILWGEDDELVPVSMGRTLHEKIPTSRFEVLQGAGHACYLEQPDKWHDELVSFLRDAATQPA
ncbi:MAG: alpha/beta fold hydrolase [Desulfovibrionales bacterium]